MSIYNKCCIWCEKSYDLLPTKRYCKCCDQLKYRECIRCGRPLNSRKYFLLDDKRCNSCHRKLLKERIKRSTR